MIPVRVDRVKSIKNVTGCKDMRPILWGIILAVIGAIGWVTSIVLTVVSLGAFKFLTYIFGILFIISLPVAGIIELVRWLKNKKSGNTN